MYFSENGRRTEVRFSCSESSQASTPCHSHPASSIWSSTSKWGLAEDKAEEREGQNRMLMMVWHEVGRLVRSRCVVVLFRQMPASMVSEDRPARRNHSQSAPRAPVREENRTLSHWFDSENIWNIFTFLQPQIFIRRASSKSEQIYHTSSSFLAIKTARVASRSPDALGTQHRRRRLAASG